MNSLMLLAIVWLRLCHKKLSLGTKSPPKEHCGDTFLVSELVLWDPLWKEKKEVGIKIGEVGGGGVEKMQKLERV